MYCLVYLVQNKPLRKIMLWLV